jgi:C4-dicarboxylate transporter/malic acid transport protein
MSTGGIALLLSPRNQPYTFKALNTIGTVVYIFDLIVFVLVTTAMTIRFSRHPSLLKRSLTHPSESLSFATCFLAMASIIGGMDLYGIPAVGSWLPVVYRVLFWIYFVVTFIVACGHYYLLFSHPKLKLQNMTPAWDLPIFPFMLCGTLAAIGASDQPPEHAIVMIVAGLTAQGLGMLVSLIMYVLYVHRMIEWGFPSPETRPAMFIAVGPPSFTSLALIGMANSFPASTGYFGLEAQQTISVLKLLATMTAVFIWCLAFWFFCLALVAILAVSKTAKFRLSWWAFVFPNVGFTLATIKIGDMLESPGVHWVGSVMTMGLVAMYLFVLTMTIKAVSTRQIMSAGKDEDTYATEEKPKQRLRLQEEKPHKEA